MILTRLPCNLVMASFNFFFCPLLFKTQFHIALFESVEGSHWTLALFQSWFISMLSTSSFNCLPLTRARLILRSIIFRLFLLRLVAPRMAGDEINSFWAVIYLKVFISYLSLVRRPRLVCCLSWSSWRYPAISVYRWRSGLFPLQLLCLH